MPSDKTSLAATREAAASSSEDLVDARGQWRGLRGRPRLKAVPQTRLAAESLRDSHGSSCCHTQTVRTWGLDLSTDPKSTGLVSIDWRSTPAAATVHLRDYRSRKTIAQTIARSVSRGDWWAVDVPFGWPQDFADYLQAHRQGPVALPRASGRRQPWAGLADRRTDVVARERTGLGGFNVSFDKLGATAAAWSVIEHALAEDHGPEMDRSGVSGSIVETWPAAAWRIWEVVPLGRLDWEGVLLSLHGRVIDAAIGQSRTAHDRDALVCALVAFARANGWTEPIPADLVEAATREGWIHLPAESSKPAHA